MITAKDVRIMEVTISSKLDHFVWFFQEAVVYGQMDFIFTGNDKPCERNGGEIHHLQQNCCGGKKMENNINLVAPTKVIPLSTF